MIQIIPQAGATNRPRDAMEKFAQSFSGVLADREAKQEQAQQLFRQQKQMQQENQQIMKLTGMDLSGITDPKQRQEAFKQAFEANSQKDFLNHVATGNNENVNKTSPQGAEMGLQNQSRQEKFDISKATDKQLVALHGHPKFKPLAAAETARRKTLVRNQPIPPEQMEKLHTVRTQEGFDDMDEVSQYRAYTDAGVSPDYAEREIKFKTPQLDRAAKKFDASYEAQKDFIDDTTSSYKAFETETKPRLLQMNKLGEDDLISPGATAFLEFAGVPLGVLDKPSNELYSKLSQDLLKGLPETYGNRILKVEVENFLKTIPTLLNSADGRRMIASNMLKLGQLKEVYYKEMRKQQIDHLESQKPLPKDFQQRVFDNVKPQIDKLNSQFVKLSEIKHIPKGHVPFFNPQGEISFVPNNPEAIEWAEKNEGERIW